jgi:hypothetical protein
MYVIVPVWLLAGLADYVCHRASRIEHTSGIAESLLHLLQFAEVGVPLLAALFLEINAAVLLVMLVGLVLHQATAVWDVRYANATRRVAPTEQHVHGVLEMTPAIHGGHRHPALAVLPEPVRCRRGEFCPRIQARTGVVPVGRHASRGDLRRAPLRQRAAARGAGRHSRRNAGNLRRLGHRQQFLAR